ncbi:hypothetical protein KHA80_07780 [Anaerobacillus sp. HL2]|nr:hypothetical protein KHA80_07780 [Anaerobacillus sp. HL2]
MISNLKDEKSNGRGFIQGEPDDESFNIMDYLCTTSVMKKHAVEIMNARPSAIGSLKLLSGNQ